MKKYTIKKLIWTEEEKNYFTSNWFNVQDSFHVWERYDGRWGLYAALFWTRW